MDLRESRVTEMIKSDDRPKWISYNNHNIKCFTEAEIGKITSNYGAMLGKGGFGEVYKGVLEDGSTVAVKRFVHNVEEDFAKELKVHSEINHRNVVRLIGYCADESVLMIVTEYIPKGNLSDVLHHDCVPIVLDTRLRIALECSEALCYMHSKMYTRVIHGDIKPANILLDDNFHAKISDFGISRLVNTNAAVFTERVTGSIGYMDPLFYRDGCLTSKSDVYSFGIVLLELITRKKASVRKGEIGIVQCFTQALATGIRRVKEDVEISSQNNMKVLEGVAKLAGECLRMEIDRRPEMTDVVERLRALRKTQAQAKQSLTIFPWGWRNKHTDQNNGQSSCRQFSLTEIESATGNFDESHLVGVGGHGNVYYGVIDGVGGPTKVAIKRCTYVTFVQNVNKFQEEITMMAKLRHRHLVSLVGFCNENNEKILIYDYVSSGTLRERLHGYKEESPLTWIQCLCVCIGVARAPHYTEITDSYHHTEIYIDTRLPEISDVYCFGVVLLEVLCARAVRDLTLPRNLVHFANSALDCKKKGILDRIVDPNLKGKIDPWCFNKFVETAEKCVAFNNVDRPSMEEVVQNLEMCLASTCSILCPLCSEKKYSGFCLPLCFSLLVYHGIFSLWSVACIVSCHQSWTLGLGAWLRYFMPDCNPESLM